MQRDPRQRLVEAVATQQQLARDHQLVGVLVEREERDGVAEGVEGPMHIGLRRYHEPGIEDSHVVAVTGPQHRVMRPEADRAIVGVAGHVTDAQRAQRKTILSVDAVADGDGD